MRLWHWKLIPVLPRQQLIAQWRECCAIARNIQSKGTPNHLLVNPIMDYPDDHLDRYTLAIGREMMNRGYNWNFHRYTDYRNISDVFRYIHMDPHLETVFPQWHTEKYLTQCLGNLEEKHDRGGISDLEWRNILGYLCRIRMKGA